MAFEDRINAKLNGEMAALEQLKRRQHARIEDMLATSRQAETLKQRLAPRSNGRRSRTSSGSTSTGSRRP